MVAVVLLRPRLHRAFGEILVIRNRATFAVGRRSGDVVILLDLQLNVQTTLQSAEKC